MKWNANPFDIFMLFGYIFSIFYIRPRIWRFLKASIQNSLGMLKINSFGINRLCKTLASIQVPSFYRFCRIYCDFTVVTHVRSWKICNWCPSSKWSVTIYQRRFWDRTPNYRIYFTQLTLLKACRLHWTLPLRRWIGRWVSIIIISKCFRNSTGYKYQFSL